MVVCPGSKISSCGEWRPAAIVVLVLEVVSTLETVPVLELPEVYRMRPWESTIRLSGRALRWVSMVTTPVDILTSINSWEPSPVAYKFCDQAADVRKRVTATKRAARRRNI